MEQIWRRSRPVLVRDVLGDLQADRTVAYTTVMTVMTVMDKLHRKDPRSRAHYS